jgi:hypothetical protein
MKFKGARDGSVVVTFDEIEVQLLREVPAQLRALYEGSGPDPDPARERLFPRAYLDPTEEAAEEQWAALVHPELLRQRLVGLDAVLRTLDGATTKGKRTAVTLSPDDVNLWLAVLNDARLAFGTRLEIDDDTDIWYSPPGDSLAPERAAYAWLTTLQSLLVDTMLETFPEGPPD